MGEHFRPPDKENFTGQAKEPRLFHVKNPTTA
jgi:hypothetical protein